MTHAGKNGDHAEGSANGGLVEAAKTLEDAIDRHARLVRALVKTSLDSEKGIARAAELVRESADAQDDISGLVQALLAAIKAGHERNAAAVEEANAFVARIDARGAELEALLVRFAELGRETSEINELTMALRSKDAPAADKEELLTLVLGRMAATRDEARSLSGVARAQGFTDVSRQTDTMAQQLASLHNKLELLAGKLG